MLKTCTVVRIIEPEIGCIHALAAGNVAPGATGERGVTGTVVRHVETIRNEPVGDVATGAVRIEDDASSLVRSVDVVDYLGDPVPFFWRGARKWRMEGRSMHVRSLYA